MSQCMAVVGDQELGSITFEETLDADPHLFVPALSPLAPSPSVMKEALQTDVQQKVANQAKDESIADVPIDHSLFDALVQQLITEHMRLLRMAAACDRRATPELSIDSWKGGADVGVLANTLEEPLNNEEITDALTGTKWCSDRSSPISNKELLEVFGDRTPSYIARQQRKSQQKMDSEYEEVCNKNKSNARIIEDSRTPLHRIVESTAFEMAFSALIFANTVVIGIEVDHAAKQLTSEPPAILVICQHAFNVAFFVELLMRISAYGKKFFYEKGLWPWHWFDLFVVGSATLESIGEAISGGSSFDVSSSNIRVVRMLRLARLVRIARISRIIRFVRALRYLVQSIIFTLKSLVWAMVLLLLIMYCFAAFLTQTSTEFRIQANLEPDLLSESSLREADYWWGSLGAALSTLFMSISGGASWHDALRPLNEIGPVAVVVFYAYITFTYFAVLNVVTGVFCQSAMESAQKDHDHMMQIVMHNKQEYKDKLKKVFNAFDLDKSGAISLDEFEQQAADPQLLAAFETLEIEMSDARDMFALLDIDKGGLIDIGELLEGCMRMKGVAKGMDMLRVKHDIKKVKDSVSHLVGMIEHIMQNASMRITRNGNIGEADSSATDEHNSP